ncbi:hypothetical protein JI435_307230 [Parastagonospora nodorum SN15]|uniref:Uncharacterized protein n=1 Tax=Phaeosphaeria nodorum (strain SN15 / ATCC MYA-4574 / FGSC 10173) TaxID=321614 RepID=A0A7U2I677_PHANO|nr:hypothetical protein JI435_307230 [Parastagonospora nodorum SN15]
MCDGRFTIVGCHGWRVWSGLAGLAVLRSSVFYICRDVKLRWSSGLAIHKLATGVRSSIIIWASATCSSCSCRTSSIASSMS